MGITADKPHSRKAATAATFALVLAAILVSRIGVLRGEWVSDTGGWMLISRLMNEGQKPYLDLWDNKLPPIYWLGQAFLATGRPRAAMFAADVAMATLAALGVAATLRRCGLSWLSALAFGGASVCASIPFCFVHSNNAYAACPFSVGLALLCLGVRRRRVAAMAATSWLSGVLIGVAGISSTLLVIPAIEGAIITWSAGASWRRRSVAFSAYASGGLTAVAGLLAFAHREGYLGPMLRDAVFGAASYASGRAAGGFGSAGKVLWDFRDNLGLGVLGWLIALLGAVAVVGSYPTRGRLKRAVSAFALIWFCSQVALTFVSGNQFGHYHYLVAWSAGLLAGMGCLGLSDLGARPPSRRPWLVPAWLAVAIALSLASTPRMAASLLALGRPRVPSHSEALGAMLRANVPAGQSLLLADGYVDALDAVVLLPNPPGTRHVLASMYDYYSIESSPRPFFARLGRDLIDSLDRDAPDWLVRAVGHQDLLSREVERLYREHCRNDDYILYQRK